MAPFQYVVTDMDGTLFSPDHSINDYTRETLKKLVHEHGVTLILATGRCYADVSIVSDNLKSYIWGEDAPLSPTTHSSNAPRFFLLTSNGAVVHDGFTHAVVSRRSVDPELAEKIIGLLPTNEEAVNTHAYQNDSWFCRIDWPEIYVRHQESGLRYICVPEPPPLTSAGRASSTDSTAHGIAAGDYDGISKIFFITDEYARLPPIEEAVRALVKSHKGPSVTLTYSAVDCLDVMAASVNKGDTLKKLFGMILPPQDGVDVVADALRHSIAFGDGLNDAEMLTAAGKGCVMQNANTKLLAQHPELEVIPSNAEDGVAKKLRSVFGIPL